MFETERTITIGTVAPAEPGRKKPTKPPHEPTPAAAIDADRLEAHLEAWVDELPERQREALLLSRFENLTHAEIAEVMEISPRTVNNHIVQALKQLRSQVRTHHPDLLSS